MRFAISEDHHAITAVVGELLANRWSRRQLRESWTAPAGQLDRGVWHEMVDMGVLSLLVPEDEGGLGMDDVALLGVLECTGRVGLTHPVVESAAVAAPFVGAASRQMLGASWRGGPVPCGADVDGVVMVDEDVRLFTTDEIELVAVDTVDGARRSARVVTVPGGGRVLSDDPAEAAAAADRAVLGVTAQLLGLAATMLDMTVDYVTQRRQFGVPVGSFQAVKHQLANALMQLEFARPAAMHAAYALAADDDDASVLVSSARVQANEAAETVGRAALQCHGAVGYTVEHDLHLFLKRSWALQRSWGDSRWHTERVAQFLHV